MGKIESIIARMAGQRAYLDTNVFVYFLDHNPEFFQTAAVFIEAAESGRIIGYTGDAAVAETLVKPYQSDNVGLAASFKAFFATDDFLSIQSHDADTFDLAAQLRGKRGMKFINALHLATALKAGCKFFVTNDESFKSDDAMEIVLIKALLKKR
ncbi:MAG: type II toxin-antitoxin system VapC family toxin [Nitrosomonadaceae bacterium]|nr:type II toxin-antitoxin system VapC family toxin [Nitrosomonadaceae bacterium]